MEHNEQIRWRTVRPEEAQMLAPWRKIGGEWMLLTAGDGAGYNTMTASWGHIGSLWGHGGGLPTAIAYVRPQRYTKEFLDRAGLYTLSFFPAEYKKALGYLGSHSGRDGDKVAAAGLTPVFGEGCTWFEEASLVLVCRKLYQAPLVEEGFVDKSIIEECYPHRDYHQMYIGEVVQVLEKG